MEEKKEERHGWSRVSTFGLGLSCSSIATTAVTIAYEVAYRIPNLDFPIMVSAGVGLTGIGLIGAGTIICGAKNPRIDRSRKKPESPQI
jgi:hypothetical protein